MAAEAYVGDTVKITVTFRNFTGALEDPASVLVQGFNAPLAATPTALFSASPTKQSDAIYYYDWTPSSAGSFVIRFTATFADASVDIVDEDFDVLLSTTSDPDPDVLLGQDIEISFASGFDYLYVNPAELSPHFEDATLLDIAEAIYFRGLEVQEMLNETDAANFQPIVFEYIKAAAACDLDSVYGYNSSLFDSIRLGDLSVTSQPFGRSKVTRENAKSWCELAGVLRKEMLVRNTRGFKSIVRGSTYNNPIPQRYFFDYENNGKRPTKKQGLLDGE